MDIWDMIASERRATADLLGGLDAEQWAMPSLCGSWSVRECAAHLTAGWNLGWGRFFVALVRHRGFDGANAALGAQLGLRPTQEIVADLRDHAEHQFTPPGSGPEAPLSDVLLHTQDIALPLGIDHAVAPERGRISLDLLTTRRGRRFQAPGGVADLRFEADDQDWSFGEGPLVTGSTRALALAISGRAPGLDHLSGDGLSEFRNRF